MKIISNNKKSKYDYFLSTHIEAGIELIGLEVKGILNSTINIKESYVKIIHNSKGNPEVFLIGANISIIDKPTWDSRDLNNRPKKLLLHRREINKLEKLTQEVSTTLICTKVYLDDRGLIKAEIALGVGKKLYDKREVIKQRDLGRYND